MKLSCESCELVSVTLNVICPTSIISVAACKILNIISMIVENEQTSFRRKINDSSLPHKISKLSGNVELGHGSGEKWLSQNIEG